MEMKHTLVLHNKKNEKLRLDFIGKHARGEAFSLLCEMQHKYGNHIGYIESLPMHKTYKTGDAALDDAVYWIEN